VLAELDTRVASSGPQLLVAHHAPTEAGILYDYRKYCPQLAATGLLDTVRLSRVLYPDLHSHGLDVVRGHLKIPPPRNRHRALPDTQLTAQIFQHLMEDGSRAGTWSSLQQVRKLGGYQARANQPYQEALFE
jgi:DNA polymerase III subunit epsilon